jgi:hypothetical protein
MLPRHAAIDTPLPALLDKVQIQFGLGDDQANLAA